LLCIGDFYAKLKGDIIGNKMGLVDGLRLKEYIPEFDSLKTSLSFLNQSASLSEKLSKD